MRNHPWDFRSRALKNWTSFCSKLIIPGWPGNSLRSKDAWATKCEPQEPKSPKAIRREKSELGTLRLGMSWEMQDANSHKFTWSYMVLHGYYMGTTWALPVKYHLWTKFGTCSIDFQGPMDHRPTTGPLPQPMLSDHEKSFAGDPPQVQVEWRHLESFG